MEYAVITGGTSGIGFELARQFLKHGYGVMIVGSNQTRLEKTKTQLEKEFSQEVKIYEQDLSQVGAAKKAYKAIKQDIKRENEKVTVLVNNAGFGLIGGIEKIELEREEQMLQLNIISLMGLTKLFISDMYKAGGGKILNIASTGAFQPGPYTASYFASKSFVLSYTKAIRYEAKKRGVKVCALCPGTTQTAFFEKEGIQTPKLAMSAEAVAQYGYEKLMKNKDVAVPGLLNKVLQYVPEPIKIASVAKMKSTQALKSKK